LSISKIAEPYDTNPRDHAIGLLDSIRHQYEYARINRIRLMIYAREQGLSCHEIGIVLGLTEDGVRKAIARAGDLG
jgi:hypothetical protein